MNIKEVLGEDLYNQVKEKIGDKDIILNDGNYIPKAKFDTINEEKKELQNKVSEADKKIEELSKVNVDELNKKYDDLQKKYDEDTQNLKNEMSKKEYDRAIDDLVRDVKFSSKSAKKTFVEDLKAKDFKFENGKLEGYEDFKKDYEKNDPTAFQKETDFKVDTGEEHSTKTSDEDAYINKIMGLD